MNRPNLFETRQQLFLRNRFVAKRCFLSRFLICLDLQIMKIHSIFFLHFITHATIPLLDFVSLLKTFQSWQMVWQGMRFGRLTFFHSNGNQHVFLYFSQKHIMLKANRCFLYVFCIFVLGFLL